jgi:hypothetical protein
MCMVQERKRETRYELVLGGSEDGEKPLRK